MGGEIIVKQIQGKQIWFELSGGLRNQGFEKSEPSTIVLRKIVCNLPIVIAKSRSQVLCHKLSVHWCQQDKVHFTCWGPF